MRAGSAQLFDDAAVAPGTGSLEIVRNGARSVVSRAFASSPLKLLTPANRGDAAWIYTSTYGGGLVNRDALSIDVQVGPAAKAYISTQASTKIFRSPEGTSSHLTAYVDAGALLVVAPDPVVCFAGSRYRQCQRYDLEPGANLVVVDWMTSGRRTAGERWAFDEYSARLSVSRGVRRLVHDGLLLRPIEGDLAERFGRVDVIATAIVIGPVLSGAARNILAASGAIPVSRAPSRLLAAAAVADDGCILRVAGSSVEDVAGVVRDALSSVPDLLGDDPWRRKW